MLLTVMVGSTALRRKCCLSKAVPCPYPKPDPDEAWSKSTFMGLLCYGITELKMVVFHSRRSVVQRYVAQCCGSGCLYQKKSKEDVQTSVADYISVTHY